MREMKDSGVEWIGMIPKHWKVHRVSNYFYERSIQNTFGQEENLLSLSYGHIIRKDINTNGGLLPANFNTYNIIEPNDIIIRPTDLQNDKRSLRTGLSSEHGIITSAYIDLAPYLGVNSKYFHYLLHTYDVEKVFYNMGNGVRQGLNFSEFAKLLLVQPPKNEQSEIVTYLDSKCAEIDSITADIQKEIELLQEYRKSVITEAVTKGLDPNVEMKDSGIEWIGSIPKHWDITKLKYSNHIKTDKLGIVIEDLNYIALENISNWTAKYIQTENSYEITDSIICKKGDVIFGKLRPYLAKGLIIEHDCCCSSEFAVFSKPECPQFLMYYLLTPSIITIINNSTYGTKMPRANISDIINLPYPLMPVSEQFEISAFLNAKCAEIDSIIEDKQKQLDTLAEYRKSLIYEYVTGKKEVPAV